MKLFALSSNLTCTEFKIMSSFIIFVANSVSDFSKHLGHRIQPSKKIICFAF